MFKRDQSRDVLDEDCPRSECLDESRIISVETVRAGVLQELVYSVVLKKNVEPVKLLEAVRAKNDNQKVTLILGRQEIDL